MTIKPIDVFDLYDTIATSTDWNEILKRDHAELAANFERDPKKYRSELLALVDRYMEAGTLTFALFPDALDGLKRIQDLGHLLGVFSTGSDKAIGNIVDACNIRSMFTELVPITAVGDGLAKNELAAYIGLEALLRQKGYFLTSYTDDKKEFAVAAAQSRAIPFCYQINRKAERIRAPQPEGIVVVNSLLYL